MILRNKFFLTITSSLFFVWIGFLLFNSGTEVMVDGITTSALKVSVIAIVFSIISWFLFSWAFRNTDPGGILLSAIVGAVVIFPFIGFMGPMFGVLIGIVSGFIASMIQKKLTNPAENKPLIIAGIVYVVMCVIVIAIMQMIQPSPHMWDTGNGVLMHGLSSG